MTVLELRPASRIGIGRLRSHKRNYQSNSFGCVHRSRAGSGSALIQVRSQPAAHLCDCAACGSSRLCNGVLLVLVAGSLLSLWLRRGLKRRRLGWVDHTLGAVFGFLRGWLICSVIYLALTAFPGKPEAVERAMFGPALLEGTRVVAYLASRELRERFLNGYETIKQLWGQRP